jgi:sarcosine oxidase subunit alpha
LGAEPVGIDAWMLLRTEKGYLHVGSDTDGTTTPGDIGWGHVLKRHDDFVGKRSLLRPANRRDGRWQLVGLEPLDSATPLEPGDHLQSAHVPTEGYVTSAGFSPTLGRTVAIGMVKGGHRRMGEEFSLSSKRGRVKIADRIAYDPTGDRLHA